MLSANSKDNGMRRLAHLRRRQEGNKTFGGGMEGTEDSKSAGTETRTIDEERKDGNWRQTPEADNQKRRERGTERISGPFSRAIDEWGA